MARWWSIRDKAKRAAAKAADTQRLAEKRAARDHLIELSGGEIREVVLDGQTGWVTPRGAFWPFSTKRERRIARLFAQSTLFPNPLLKVIVEDDGSISLKGLRSGTMYSVDASSGYVLRPHYKAAVMAEKRWRPKELRVRRLENNPRQAISTNQ
jgi:hypothetical protein